MSAIRSHKDLEVWKISMDLVVDLYDITKKLPKEERYGLTSQMRRAAVSIPSNIAEGAARKNPGEFIQFLHISLGSLAELETQIEISIRLNYISEKPQTQDAIIKIRVMLSGLIRSLKAKKH